MWNLSSKILLVLVCLKLWLKKCDDNNQTSNTLEELYMTLMHHAEMHPDHVMTLFQHLYKSNHITEQINHLKCIIRLDYTNLFSCRYRRVAIVFEAETFSEITFSAGDKIPRSYTKCVVLKDYYSGKVLSLCFEITTTAHVHFFQILQSTQLQLRLKLHEWSINPP